VPAFCVLSLHGRTAHYNGKVNGSIDGEVIERAVNHFFKKNEHLPGRTIRQTVTWLQNGYER
jgi:hypothetical protein